MSQPAVQPLKAKPFLFPKDSEPCLCGSDKLFGECCGSKALQRKPPVGVFVIENALSEKQCEELKVLGHENEKEWLTTLALNNATGEFESVRDKGRVTQKVAIESCFEPINEVVGGAWVNTIEPFLNCLFQWFEQPTMLLYSSGGKYGAHSDAEKFDEKSGLWERSIDRDWSMLIYLNDDFEGGELYFPNFNYHYKPKKADLVFFPSDHRYVHEAKPVTSGERYALVSWAALENGPRSSSEPPPSSIEIWR